MKRTARRLVIAGVTVGAVAIVLFGAWVVLTRLPYPRTRGRVRLEGISAPVEILRDRWGVPHIYARTSGDLFFAQGYVHAQDRFWQMEFWRRLGAGRLSELLGEATLETDKYLRTLGLAEAARRSWEGMDADSRAAMEAYAAGVNAYILNRPSFRLGLEFTRLVQAVYHLDQASNFEEFRAALSQWDIAHQNVVYADVDGNIGYQSTGRLPVRAAGDGTAPVPGWTDEYEWVGYIPFGEMPYLLNPKRGYIATANNPIVGPEYEHFLGSEWDMGYRARRIREMIEEDSDGITIEDIQRMQGDVLDQGAAETVPFLRGLDLAAAAAPPPKEKPEKEPAEEGRRAERRRLKDEEKARKELEALEQARERLLAWDDRMDRDSPEAALYACFFLKLVEQTFKDQYPESEWPPGTGSRINSTLYTLLQDPENPWWDDAGTPDVRETRDEILARAFVKGYRYAVKNIDKHMNKWRWGKVHTAEFRNATLGESGIGPIEKIFNRGPVEVQGGTIEVDAAGWRLEEPFEIRHIVSQRLIVDLGDLGRSLSVHTTGQSGHPTNRHYDDFIDPWRNVEYHPTLWDQQAVKKGARARLRLLPPR